MESKKYEIKYLPTFIEQFNTIIHHIKHELQNQIAAENFYNEAVKAIEERSIAPESFEVFKTINKVKWYKIRVKNFIIFYIVNGSIMEVSRIYYCKRDFKKLI